MNDRLTEIAFILDRSGSMASMVEPAIAGFNTFLRDQQQAAGDARLTLVLFDNEYLVPCASLPVAEVVELDTTTFVPRGSTALLDAIGRTIDELGARLAAIPEVDRPGQVVVAILTDGEENSSQRFTWQDIAQKIGHQENHYAWQFLFLGANQDAIATAARMGVAAANSASYVHDAAGYTTSSKAMSRKVIALRTSKLDPAAPQADLAKPLAEILREEDEQERGR
jgi:Mg-chelatase subunit ChlD